MALFDVQVPSPQSLRRLGARYRAAIPLALLVLACSSCDEEPSCGIFTTLGGSFEGLMELNGTGRDSCGFADATMIDRGNSALAFSRDSGAMYLFFESSVITAGGHLGAFRLSIDGNIWESAPGACTITVEDFTLEEWSKIDFFQISGTAACPDPLVSTTGAEDVTVSLIQFDAHLHAEVLDFDFT